MLKTYPSFIRTAALFLIVVLSLPNPSGVYAELGRSTMRGEATSEARTLTGLEEALRSRNPSAASSSPTLFLRAPAIGLEEARFDPATVKILIVEDSKVTRKIVLERVTEVLAKVFADRGLSLREDQIVVVVSKADALAKLPDLAQDLALVITDLQLGESEIGSDVARAAKERNPNTAVVVMSIQSQKTAGLYFENYPTDMDEFIEKKNLFNGILAVIEKFVANRLADGLEEHNQQKVQRLTETPQEYGAVLQLLEAQFQKGISETKFRIQYPEIKVSTGVSNGRSPLSLKEAALEVGQDDAAGRQAALSAIQMALQPAADIPLSGMHVYREEMKSEGMVLLEVEFLSAEARVQETLEVLRIRTRSWASSADKGDKKWVGEAKEVAGVLERSLSGLRTVPSGNKVRDDELVGRVGAFLSRADRLLEERGAEPVVVAGPNGESSTHPLPVRGAYRAQAVRGVIEAIVQAQRASHPEVGEVLFTLDQLEAGMKSFEGRATRPQISGYLAYFHHRHPFVGGTVGHSDVRAKYRWSAQGSGPSRENSAAGLEEISQPAGWETMTVEQYLRWLFLETYLLVAQKERADRYALEMVFEETDVRTASFSSSSEIYPDGGVAITEAFIRDLLEVLSARGVPRNALAHDWLQPEGTSFQSAQESLEFLRASPYSRAQTDLKGFSQRKVVVRMKESAGIGLEEWTWFFGPIASERLPDVLMEIQHKRAVELEGPHVDSPLLLSIFLQNGHIDLSSSRQAARDKSPNFLEGRSYIVSLLREVGIQFRPNEQWVVTFLGDVSIGGPGRQATKSFAISLSHFDPGTLQNEVPEPWDWGEGAMESLGIYLDRLGSLYSLLGGNTTLELLGPEDQHFEVVIPDQASQRRVSAQLKKMTTYLDGILSEPGIPGQQLPAVAVSNQEISMDGRGHRVALTLQRPVDYIGLEENQQARAVAAEVAVARVQSAVREILGPLLAQSPVQAEGQGVILDAQIGQEKEIEAIAAALREAEVRVVVVQTDLKARESAEHFYSLMGISLVESLGDALALLNEQGITEDKVIFLLHAGYPTPRDVLDHLQYLRLLPKGNLEPLLEVGLEEARFQQEIERYYQ